MAKGISSTRQITHTRIYDDGNLDTRYEILNKLGEGSFGMVFRVKNKENEFFYAMKTIAKKVFQSNFFSCEQRISSSILLARK